MTKPLQSMNFTVKGVEFLVTGTRIDPETNKTIDDIVNVKTRNKASVERSHLLNLINSEKK
jgi:hypothetical protein